MSDRSEMISEVIKIIEFGRERGERDLRQIREWVRSLEKQTADEFIASMNREEEEGSDGLAFNIK